jgi:cyclophilin family peptidyl-prolyl cis-trans isomerase
LILLVSTLAPARTWYPPSQPVTVNVKSEGDAKLVLTDFAGKAIEPKGSADVSGEKSVDVKSIFPGIADPGTYVLYVVGKDKPLSQFEGTPLVIETRTDRRPGGPGEAEVIKVAPLQYVVMTTESGPLTMAFYYDVAPNTVDSFQKLAAEGYFDGLTFHRIVPGFVIQGGDPKGDGTGGPGYHVEAEFNDHPHLPGVLSMARSQSPNSGGSQFFVCLDYTKTQHLDRQYTAFGVVTDGMKAVEEIAKTKLSNPDEGKPVKPPVIQKAETKPVTATNNPYAQMLHLGDGAAQGK